MATSVSDLGKALGKPVVGLGERSAEDESYDAAMQRIQLLLAQRENKPYNPTLLAIAQGFLAPSATGSFGEGAGAAAGNVLKIQEQEQKQEKEPDSMVVDPAEAAWQKEQERLALEKAAKEVAAEQGFSLNRGTSVGARLIARSQKRA
jgi:hypothetical protein